MLCAPPGGQEEVRQGNREILQRPGEAPESVGQEEGGTVAGGGEPSPLPPSPSHHPTCLTCLSLPLSQADSQVEGVRQQFYQVSLDYVFKVQEVQERKMFDFVEPVSHWRHGPGPDLVLDDVLVSQSGQTI